MKGRTELEFPYNEIWKVGYVYFQSKQGRWYIQLVAEDRSNDSITSYARYKMAVHLGRFLNPDEQVDHIDENKANDDISNLQILTCRENNVKHVKACGKEEKRIDLICPNCNKEFSTPRRVFNSRRKNNKNQYCSKKCNHQANPPIRNKIDDAIKDEIKRLRKDGLSSYKISEKLGIARNTVMKYWK